MLDDDKFTLPDDLERAAAQLPAVVEPAAAGPPAQVIVVEHRTQGVLARLTLPLLVLCVALGITTYQRTRPIALPPPTPRSDLAAKSAKTPAEPTTKPEVAAKPVVELPIEPAPMQERPTSVKTDLPAPVDLPGLAEKEGKPDGLVQTGAEKAATKSIFELNASEGLQPVELPPTSTPGQSPAPTQVEVAAEPMERVKPPSLAPVPPVSSFELLPPQAVASTTDPNAAATTQPSPAALPNGGEVTKEAILSDIQREAEAREDERRNLEEIKPKARALMLAETLGRIQASRAAFRNDLKDIVNMHGPDAGQLIDELCTRHGRQIPPEVQTAYYRALRVAPKRMTKETEVDFMRIMGLPEPVILDFLAHKIHKTINTRGGPRDENEVRLRAAQQLLSIPIHPPKNGASPTNPFASAAAPGGNADANPHQP